MNKQSKVLKKTAESTQKNSNTSKKNAKEMSKDSKKPRGKGKIHEHHPKTELVKLFKYILTIEKEKEEKKKKGEMITDAQKTKLNKTKAKIMREFAYPSMASLMFLFSKLAKHPILRKSFRREVGELIGMDGLQKALGHYEATGPSFENSFKDNNFASLLQNIIMSLQYDIENDYTIFFLYQIQCCITEPIIDMIYKNQGVGNKASKQVTDKLIEVRDYVPTIINDSIKTKSYSPSHDKISI